MRLLTVTRARSSSQATDEHHYPTLRWRLTPSEQSGKPNDRVDFAFEVQSLPQRSACARFHPAPHMILASIPPGARSLVAAIEDGIRGELRVQIPDARNAPAGRQEFLLTGVPHGEDAPTLTAMGALTIAEDRCGKLALRPSFRWDDDGGLTATLKIDNCGNLSLRSKVRLRCDDMAKDPVDVHVQFKPTGDLHLPVSDCSIDLLDAWAEGNLTVEKSAHFTIQPRRTHRPTYVSVYDMSWAAGAPCSATLGPPTARLHPDR